jgi:nucleoid-associated protein YgaU
MIRTRSSTAGFCGFRPSEKGPDLIQPGWILRIPPVLNEVKHPDLIQPGWVLRIPPARPTRAASKKARR